MNDAQRSQLLKLALYKEAGYPTPPGWVNQPAQQAAQQAVQQGSQAAAHAAPNAAAHAAEQAAAHANPALAAQVAEQPGLFRRVVEAPFNLVSSIGQGIQGGSEAASAAAKALEAQGHGGMTRTFGAIPAGVSGLWDKFHGSGGLGAAALTGLGGLAIYGGKKIYDDARNRYLTWQYSHGTPESYYVPGGY